MKYKSVLKAEFLYRKNRFISYCKKGSKILEVYVPNTGRCKELLLEGTKVFVTYNDNKKRKTSYTLIAVVKGKKIINIDSQAPNQVVEEALLQNKIDLGFKYSKIKRKITPENRMKTSVFRGDLTESSKSPASIAKSNKQWVGTCLYQEWYKPLLISCEAAIRL